MMFDLIPPLFRSFPLKPSYQPSVNPAALFGIFTVTALMSTALNISLPNVGAVPAKVTVRSTLPVCAKALLPMFLTDGSFAFSNEIHPANALLPILLASDNVTLCNEEESANAHLPIFIAEVKFICCSETQPANALLPMLVAAGKFTFCSELQS